MPTPLSQLMKTDDPDLGPPEATYSLCLAAKLYEQLEDASDAYAELEARVQKARQDAEDGDRESAGAKRRVGHKPLLRDLEAQAEVAAAEADAIRGRMAAKSVDVRLVVKEDAWRTLISKNPAREPQGDASGARRDRMYGAQLVNVDALLAVADTFIGGYGDEAPTEQSWPFARAKSAPGDRDWMAARIVQIHTQGVSLGKSRTDLRASHRTSPAPE